MTTTTADARYFCDSESSFLFSSFLVVSSSLVYDITYYIPHTYADDTQVYGSCRPVAVDALSSEIAIVSWMESNRLSLNCDKNGSRMVCDKSTTPASVVSSVS